MSPAAVRLLGHMHEALALELASIGAAFIAPDAVQPSSFSAVQFSRAPIATSVDPAGSAGDPDGARGSHTSEGDACE